MRSGKLNSERVMDCCLFLSGYHDPRRDNPLCLVLAPVPVYIPYKSPKTVEILQLSAGRAHCAILSTEGVHFLGHNAYGQCGRPIVENEDYIRNKVPSQAIRLGNEKIVSVCCGQDHRYQSLTVFLICYHIDYKEI